MNNINTQVASGILMVRPSNFGFNLDTTDDNSFQVDDERLTKSEIVNAAKKEFDDFVKVLQNAGIQIHIHHEKEESVSTDSVFPNNWFSCHADGTLITYPMFSEKRRTERLSTIISELKNKFQINKHIRLEKWEKSNQYLEGTGSMVLDREHKIAYACRSNRTDGKVIDEFCELKGFSKILFDAVDKTGLPIYHTNVMMSIGDTFSVICLEAVKNKVQKETLVDTLKKSDKDLIIISFNQMEEFAGNMIQLKNSDDLSFLVMSSRAYRSLEANQIIQIQQYTQILHSDLKVIETYGGGSARCMIAELFFPNKN